MKTSRSEARHRRVFELLPWFANGTLEPAERRGVEEHLAACRECTEELARCRELAEAVRAATVPAPAPHPVQLRGLLARIDQLPARPPGWRARLRRLPTRGRLGALVLLQSAAVLILLLGPHVRTPASLDPAPYRTLSSATPAVAGPSLRVVFAEGATLGEIRVLLGELTGEITAGPSRHGVCTVRLGPGVEPETALARLRSSSAVVFAEPAAGDDGAP